jgi:hypothetical protein
MLNSNQYEQLLKPLNPARVAKRKGGGGKELSYLEAWEVKAHLIRIFGFLGWEWEVTEAVLAFEELTDGKWSVGYKVVGTLTIKIYSEDRYGYRTAQYAEAAIGFATLGSRGEAHDMAIKTAESDALKRAAINLGTQFGLSLYNNGSTKDVIGRTLDREQTEDEPVDAKIGTSEVVGDSEGAEEWINVMKEGIASKDVNILLSVKQELNKDDMNEATYQGMTLAKWLDKAIAQVNKK